MNSEHNTANEKHFYLRLFVYVMAQKNGTKQNAKKITKLKLTDLRTLNIIEILPKSCGRELLCTKSKVFFLMGLLSEIAAIICIIFRSDQR